MRDRERGASAIAAGFARRAEDGTSKERRLPHRAGTSERGAVRDDERTVRQGGVHLQRALFHKRRAAVAGLNRGEPQRARTVLDEPMRF